MGFMSQQTSEACQYCDRVKNHDENCPNHEDTHF